jgi:hypothetical protein
LPVAIISACMSRQEFYFHHRVTAAVAMNLPAP